MASNTSATVRIVCVSDTHSRYQFSIPTGDILVHTGDFSMSGEQIEVESYLNCLKSLTHYRLKVIIAGNHDITLEPAFYEKNWERWHRGRKQNYEEIGRLMRDPSLATQYGIIYLEDQAFVDNVTGLKFYGSPYQPEFNNWAFNLPRDSAQIKQVWSRIPNDVDVLLTHGPPIGILDTNHSGEHTGCAQLLASVMTVKPRLHVFGHIHEAYGRVQLGSTIFVNASVCDFSYQPVQAPIAVDLALKRN